MSQQQIILTPRSGRWTRFRKAIVKHRYLYLLATPAIIWYIIFRYIPLFGVQIAFRDFNLSRGIFHSEWVGLRHFRFLFFQSHDFFSVVSNTIIINIMNLLVFFPMGIILALLLNELRNKYLKRTIQTAVYFPHFLSWVIYGGIIIFLLSPSDGLVNALLRLFGREPIFFMTRSEYFRWIIVFSNVLKDSGWAAIIYLAALSGVDMQLYEAAFVDGAGRWKRLIHVTIPGIRNAIIIMLILRVGNLLEVGFEQIFVLYNPAVFNVGDVISTYIYRVGLQNLQFSITTAMGLFQSVIGFTLILMVNWLARRYSDVSLF